MHSREWVRVGLERRHLCAEVKSLERVEIWRTRGATVSVGNSGCRSHVLGIWRECWEFCVLGSDHPSSGMGGLSPCSKNRGEQMGEGWKGAIHLKDPPKS